MENNPYAAPRAHVDDVAAVAQGDYVPEGIGRPVGRGFTWIVDGFRTFFQSPGTWLLLSFLYMIIFLLIQYGPMLLFGAGAGSMTGMMAGVLISSIAVMLLFPVLMSGVMQGAHALAEGEPLSVAHLFRGFSTNPGRLMLTGLIYLVGFIIIVVIVSMFSGGLMPLMMRGMGAGMTGGIEGGSPGMALLPVLIMLALTLPLVMAVLFTPALIGINDETTLAAMANSFKGCLKNILPFLVYGVAFLVLMILLGLVFGLIAGGLMSFIFRPEAMMSDPVTAMIVGMVSGAVIVLLFGLVMIPVGMGSIYSSYRDIYYEGDAA
jgi:hypothetical protein